MSSSEHNANADVPSHRPADPAHLSSGLAATEHGPRLFPPPLRPPSVLSPRTFPGADAASTAALVKTLADNHVRWHIFFNDKHFHNHAAHHLLAIWSLGAPASVIEAAYATHCAYQRPAFASPGPVHDHNVYEHLGDERYYAAYVDYFASQLLQKGLNRCLEEYIFASQANFGTDARPEMLSRFAGGLLHPFIHVGYGAEFGSIGVTAEGLALTAATSPNPDLLPRVWFPDVISSVDTRVAHRTALSILALVSCDPRLSHIESIDEKTARDRFLSERSPIIHDYVNTWKFDVSTEDGIADAVEELSWANDLIYGVGGFSADAPFNANFFLMHLVTSSLFLPSLLACIDKLSSRRLLLMAYFTASLSVYVARGRPKLDVRSFYEHTENSLHKVPGPKPAPVSGTLPTPASDEAHTPNAWYPILQSTIVHPNEHLCKAHRALAHHAALYGGRKRGWHALPQGRTVTAAQEAREEEAEEKVGLQALDGTFFLRVATLTQNRLGWMREGESAGSWDHTGF